MKVAAPDGRRWKVTRRWSPRAGAAFGRRFRRRTQRFRGSQDAAGAAGALSGYSPVFGAIAALIAIVVFVFLVVPLFVEAMVVLALMGLSVLARVVLRRPWTIEAVSGEDRIERSVVGWRAGGAEIAALADDLRHGRPTEAGSS